MKTQLYRVKNLGFTNKVEDLENIFAVHKDKEFDILKPNLNETVYFDLDPGLIIPYRLDHPLHWPTISYRLFKTVRLAWFLMKLNNVKADQCFDRVPPGTVILAVSEQTAKDIISRVLDLEP